MLVISAQVSARLSKIPIWHELSYCILVYEILMLTLCLCHGQKAEIAKLKLDLCSFLFLLLSCKPKCIGIVVLLPQLTRMVATLDYVLSCDSGEHHLMKCGVHPLSTNDATERLEGEMRIDFSHS